MRTSDEIKARLRHGTHELLQAQQPLATVSNRILELLQAQQLLATVSDRIQTATDEIKVCNDRADLIDPTIDALHRQLHNLTEEMDRVYALRNDDSDEALKLEISQLKKQVTNLQQALRVQERQYQAQLDESAKSNELLVQRVQSLERFNNLLKVNINDMKERYETAIIDVADQKNTIAGQADTIRTLQNTSPFNVIANATAATSDTSGGNARGLLPFGKTVVETSRGVKVTIESSAASSPAKSSLNHGWISPIPSGTPFPFPEIAAQPQATSLTSGNGGFMEKATHAAGRPKSRAIVRGTQEANESFERMKRSLLSSSLTDSTNIVNVDNNITVASSSSAPGPAMTTTNPFEMQPVTPSKVKAKLNPTVAAFTPSNSSGKHSTNSGNLQAASPSKPDLKHPVMATDGKELGFVPPHLKRQSNISIKEAPVTPTEELPVSDGINQPTTVTTSDQHNFVKLTEPLKAASSTPHILPHLRGPTTTKNQASHPSHAQRVGTSQTKKDAIGKKEPKSREPAFIAMKENIQAANTSSTDVKDDSGLQAWLDTQEKPQSTNASSHELALVTNDALIDFGHDESPRAGEKKTASVPPGFTPFSSSRAPAETEKAAPTQTDQATSRVAVSDNVTSERPATKSEEATAVPEFSNKSTTEKEKVDAFLSKYSQQLDSVTSKYGKKSHDSSDAKDGNQTDPFAYMIKSGVHYYNPPPIVGTHDLGSLLDDACAKLVLRPRKEKTAQAHGLDGQEWKAIRKDGRVFYVL